MKKSLIALAVLGAFSATASAQSSVTMYGIIDIGVQWNKTGVLKAGTPARYEQESVFGVDSGFQSGSRLGVRGSEALGGGLNFIFTLESGFDISTGTLAQGSRFYGRQAWGGLQGGWGSAVAGRIAAPSSGTGSWDMWGQIDPFGTGFSSFGLQATFIPSNAQRYDNALLYSSPTWGGFKFAAMYSFNTNGVETAPQGSNMDQWGVYGSWGMGPFYAAVTYDVIQFADAGSARAGAGLPKDQKMLQVGGTWDFKLLKVHGAYGDFSGINSASGVNVNNPLPTALIPAALAGAQYDASAWMLGVTVPLFGGNILASYQKFDGDQVVGSNAAANLTPEWSVWGVGYTYPLSRRTNIYVAYGQRSWDGQVFATGGSPAFAQPSQVFNTDQFGLGIRHFF